MDATAFPDERLELVFTCCHPALATEAQVALTLRTLGGLTTRRDRARVPRARGDDGAAARAREAQDQGGRHPVPRPARPPAARPPRRGARGRLPHLQRGLRAAAPRGPRRRGAAARPRARRAHARRARGARPAGADAPARRPPRGARSTRGDLVLLADQDRALWDADADRGRARRAWSARSRCAGAGRTSCRPRSPSLHADAPRDWPQIAALYGELARPPARRRRAQPRGRGRRGGGAGGRPRDRRRARPRRASTTCTRRAPSCCAASAAPPRPAPPTRRALALVHDDAERRLLERRLAALE